MAGTLLLMGCSASKGPNLNYDRYKTPSDLFRELGLKYKKDSYYEYIGHNLREHHDHFNAYCKLKNGIWTIKDKTVVNPRLLVTGFYSQNQKNDYTKVTLGECTVSDESFFEFNDFWNGKESVAIDSIAKKEYEMKLKEKGQVW